MIVKKDNGLSIEEKKKRRKKTVIRVIVIVVVFFLVSNAIATKIIYDSIFNRYDGTPDFELDEYSDLINNRMEIGIAEGKETLQGYFYDVEDEQGLIVVAPGLHAGADDYLPMTGYFVAAGWDVLSFDPLGCCKSTGKSTIGFSQEIEDLDAVLSYAKANFPDEKIVLFGHSRGGFAVCSMLDGKHEIDAVVTVSGINSAMEAIIGLSERYIGKAANLNYFNLWAYQVILFDKATMDIEADDLISASDVPVLVIQGSEDHTAPTDEFSVYSHSAEITSQSVEYTLCTEEGSNGHTDLMFDEDGVNDALMAEIIEFYTNAVAE